MALSSWDVGEGSRRLHIATHMNSWEEARGMCPLRMVIGKDDLGSDAARLSVLDAWYLLCVVKYAGACEVVCSPPVEEELRRRKAHDDGVDAAVWRRVTFVREKDLSPAILTIVGARARRDPGIARHYRSLHVLTTDGVWATDDADVVRTVEEPDGWYRTCLGAAHVPSTSPAFAKLMALEAAVRSGGVDVGTFAAMGDCATSARTFFESLHAAYAADKAVVVFWPSNQCLPKPSAPWTSFELSGEVPWGPPPGDLRARASESSIRVAPCVGAGARWICTIPPELFECLPPLVTLPSVFDQLSPRTVLDLEALQPLLRFKPAPSGFFAGLGVWMRAGGCLHATSDALLANRGDDLRTALVYALEYRRTFDASNQLLAGLVHVTRAVGADLRGLRLRARSPIEGLDLAAGASSGIHRRARVAGSKVQELADSRRPSAGDPRHGRDPRASLAPSPLLHISETDRHALEAGVVTSLMRWSARMERVRGVFPGIRFAVEDTPNYGHQSSTLAALQQLRDMKSKKTKYTGPVQIVCASEKSAAKARLLLTPELHRSIVVGTHGLEPALLTILGGADEDPGLSHLTLYNSRLMLVLQPMQWPHPRRLLGSRVSDLAHESIADGYKSFVPMPGNLPGLDANAANPLRAPDESFAKTLAAELGARDRRVRPLLDVEAAIDNRSVDTTAFYFKGDIKARFVGSGHAIRHALYDAAMNFLSGLRYAQDQPGSPVKPIVVFWMNEDDGIPVDPDWQVHDPRAAVEHKGEAGADGATVAYRRWAEVFAPMPDEKGARPRPRLIVLRVGAVPQRVFHALMAQTTLPPLLEGANTANFMHTATQRPYLRAGELQRDWTAVDRLPPSHGSRFAPDVYQCEHCREVLYFPGEPCPAKCHRCKGAIKGPPRAPRRRENDVRTLGGVMLPVRTALLGHDRDAARITPSELDANRRARAAVVGRFILDAVRPDSEVVQAFAAAGRQNRLWTSNQLLVGLARIMAILQTDLESAGRDLERKAAVARPSPHVPPSTSSHAAASPAPAPAPGAGASGGGAASSGKVKGSRPWWCCGSPQPD